MNCAECDDKACEGGKDCTGGHAPEVARTAYKGEDLAMLRAAAEVEAEHYLQATRLEEVAILAKKLRVERVGIAFCIGLAEEAREVSRYLGRYFEVHSAACKVGGVSKDEFGLKHLHGPARETSCNPAGQAAMLDKAGCGLNVVIGLCVGHDATFCKHSKAPVVTLAAKDRVLAHNPLGAIYSRYHRDTRLGIGAGGASDGSSEVEDRSEGSKI